jgi:hypothetical protein
MRAPSIRRAPRPDLAALLAAPAGATGLDGVVIAPAPLAAAAEALVAAHAARGLVSKVVQVEDLFDAYGFGARTPEALRRYLAELVVIHGLRFATLAGAGSLDERGLLGTNDALLPLPLRTVPSGLAAFDAAYADPDGDGALDIAIGRVPVTTAAALRAYGEKLAGAGAPTRALVLHDDDQAHAPFSASAADVADLFPWPYTTVGLGPLALADARRRMFAELAAGVGVTLYVGHGGLDRLAAEGLLTKADVPGLAGSRAGVVVGLTCVINRFETPGFSSLGESLAASPAALAVLAPAQPAVHDESEAFGRELAAQLAVQRFVGDAFLRAARLDPAVGAGFALLGDPTAPVGTPAPAAAFGCGAGAGGMSGLETPGALLLAMSVWSRRRRRR